MPNIGYGSDKKTRHFLPNKFRKFVVHNVSDLELLMMHNRYLLTMSFYYSIYLYRKKILSDTIFYSNLLVNLMFL